MRVDYGRWSAEFNRAERSREKRKQDRVAVVLKGPKIVVGAIGNLIGRALAVCVIAAFVVGCAPLILAAGVVCFGVCAVWCMLTDGKPVSEIIKEHAKHNVIIK